MKTKTSTLFILLFSLLPALVYSQASFPGEGSNWRFGDHAAITWCSTVAPNNTPAYVSGSALFTNEGVATISDAACNLLFYSDGITVWDANDVPWPNSLPGSPGGELLGDPSSTQSGVIVPQPLNPDIYYLFAVDNNIGADGLTYSKASMSLNGGLGDIDINEKNVLLMTPACEKIAAVAHANGIDIWVIAHEWNSNNFYAYIVTPSGFNYSNPVISSVGSVMSGSSSWTRGYLKASPGGGMIAAGVEGANFYELFDFDNATGVLSNALNLSDPSFDDCYGVEFSADEHFLYGSERWGWDIHQWDVSLPTASIAASHITVATLGTANGGALQLGPDLKIYIARNSTNFLGCINDPMVSGTACNYVDNQVPLQSSSREGLPTFIATFFNQAEFEVVTSCDNDTVFFTIPNPQGLDMGYWNFNYPSSDPFYNTQSTNAEMYFLYPAGGVYTVELITERNGDYDTVYSDIYFSSYPVVDLGPDPVLCTNETMSFDLSYNDPYALDGSCDYFWEADLGTNVFYDSSATYFIDKPGTYTVTVYSDSICGSVTDSITVVYNNVEANLGVDINSGYCVGDTVVLDATYTNTNFGTTFYSWSTNQISPSINVTSSGTYSVTLSLGLCTSSDTVNVEFDAPLIYPLGPDYNLCDGATTVLDALNPGSSYIWSTGVLTNTVEIDIPGTYSVSVTNACGTIVDEINLLPLDVPDVELGSDITICEGSPEIIDAYSEGATYLWSTGDVMPQIAVFTGGNYAVTVTNECGSGSDAINVTAEQPLNLDLGPDTTVCSGYILDCNFPNLDYYWSNNEMTQSIVVTQADDYSVDVTNTCGTYSDYIHIDIIQMDLDLGADTVICEGDVLVLDAMNPDAAFNWSTGSVSQTIDVTESGQYWVTVTNICESKSDSINVDVFELTLDLGDDTAICEQSVITLDAGHPGATYLWSNGEDTQTIDITQAGTYSVTVSNYCGSLNDEINLTVNPLPVVDFGTDTISVSENDLPVVLNPGVTGIEYLWSTGDTTATIEVNTSDDYFVTVTNENGCIGYGEVYVEVRVGISETKLENAVSIYPNPTKGLLNISTKGVKIKQIRVYNAIGKLIKTYEIQSSNSTINTADFSEGVYFLKFESFDNHYFVKPFSVIK